LGSFHWERSDPLKSETRFVAVGVLVQAVKPMRATARLRSEILENIGGA
jgi:hypothetical protein